MVRTDPPPSLAPPRRAARSARVSLPRAWRGDVAAIAVLILLPVVIFGIPAIAGHAVIPGDDMTQNLPLRALAGQQIRAGHLPLFNPYIWSGAPLLADWNAAAAYPLTWLFAILPATAAWTAGLIVTYAVAGLGMYGFLRALALGRLASFLGAMTFAFAGAMPAQVSHFGLVAGMSWVPVALLAVLRLSQDRTVRSRFAWTAALGASVGLVILAGEPRAVDDAAVIVLGFAAWRLMRRGRGRLPAAVSVLSGLVLGAGLGAVQWLPGLAAVATSQRATSSMFLYQSGSLPGNWLLLTLVPDLLGGSGSLGQPAFFAGYNLTEVTSYAGVLPLVAAVALLARLPLGRRAAGQWPQWLIWHVIALAGAVLALGGNTPLGGLLYRLPLFGGQRLQSRNILVLDLALAVLLAYWVGQPVAVDAPRRARFRETVLGLVPALAVVVVAILGCADGPALLQWLGLGAAHAARVAGQLRPWLVPYAVLGSAAALLVIFRRRIGQRTLTRLTTGLVITDIVIFTLLSVVAVAPGQVATTASGHAATTAQGQAAATAPGQAATTAPGHPGASASTSRDKAAAKPAPVRPVAALGYQGRFAIYDPDLLDAGQLSALGPPDLNSVGASAMPSVQGYTSLVDGRYAAATGAHLATGGGQDTMSPSAIGDGTLDRLDTVVLLTLPSYAHTVLRDVLLPPRWQYAGQDGPFAVYANRLARGPLTLQALPGRSIGGAWIKTARGDPTAPSQASVFSPRGARVVRSVAAIPGWTASWKPGSGPAVALPVHSDGLVQSVDVPPGSGTLTWSYSPPRFTAGLALSLAATTAIGALLVAAASSRRRGRAAGPGLPVPHPMCEFRG